jgi:phage terminase large subunit GpA-like protein
MLDAASEARALFEAGSCRWAPPPRLSVSEWAERYRRLPETSAAKGGPWRNETAPYLVEPMNMMRCSRDDGNRDVRKVVWMKGAQSGGSSGVENVIGFHIEHDPCAILVVHPTFESAQEWSKERLDDMVRSTPALAERVRDRRTPRGGHDTGSTITHKTFPGGQLFTGGANTPNTFARRAARLVIADDYERFPVEVGEEGDPGDLLVPRTASFHDGLVVYVSTPALKGGRIDSLYRRSDQRRYHVACPACGHEDWITWRDQAHFRIVWQERDPRTARVECPECHARHDETARRKMVAAGRWIATREAEEPGLIGYHMPAMISTLGIATLPWLVSSFLAANGKGRKALRVFINTFLAEGWEEEGSRIEASALLGRREVYAETVDVPAPASVLTAGVDVQVDRFQLQVIAWAPGLERYLVDWRAIPGDPKRAETQEALWEALRIRYRHASGHQLPILATCVDSGYATDEVYGFVLAHQASRVYATKGFAGHAGKPIVFKRGQSRPGKLLSPYSINVDDGKDEIVAGLARPKPKDWKPGDPIPGFFHLPEAVADEAYLQEITAEHREVVTNKSGVAVKAVWVQDRANEALDTAVMCLAALHILAGTNPAAYVRRQAERLAAEPVPDPAAPRVAPAALPAKPAAPPARRVARSGYLSGR